ncbi:GTPase Era [bacterium]|nr:GTPase Era [bacterium]
MSKKEEFHSGFVALIGKPNVGKSTILNYIVGKKVAITSDMPQTTRHRVLGVWNSDNCQIVFVDTPGFHVAENRLGEWMLDSAKTEGAEADIAVMVVDGSQKPDGEDKMVADFLNQSVANQKILLVNKVDKVDRKEELLPRIAAYNKMAEFSEVYPTSAIDGDNIEKFLSRLSELLPIGDPYFPKDQLSDQNDEKMAEEIIREKVLLNTYREVPHAVAVKIEECRPALNKNMQYIRATIYVEREGQKTIVLGRKGERLREIGSSARVELEQIFNSKVYLDLWVKVKEDWRDRPDWLRVFGYEYE